MTKPLDPNLIDVRDLSEMDVPKILDYWFRSPAGFVEKLGVDTSKLPSESEMSSALTEKCRKNSTLSSSKLNALIITYDGGPVGFHTLSPYTENENGIFHAHIFKSDMRGRGISLRSYPLACTIFIRRFQLKKIIFKTPAQNQGAIRVKEKLGMRLLGEERVGFGIIKNNTFAKVFEATAEEIAAMMPKPRGPE